MGVSDNVETVRLPNPATNAYALYDLAGAWTAATCPHCGGNQALLVGRAGARTGWFRCVTCLKGFVRNEQTISPSARPLRTPDKLPDGDLAVWEEVRICLGSGAYMAAVMLCRKLLLHIAVAAGLPEENEKGRGPGFAECVTHLATAGVITQQMLEWVEPIKDIGNEATHKIVVVTKEQAEQVATFTLQLLVLAYELRMTPVDEAAEPVEPVEPPSTTSAPQLHVGPPK